MACCEILVLQSRKQSQGTAGKTSCTKDGEAATACIRYACLLSRHMKKLSFLYGLPAVSWQRSRLAMH